MTCHIVTMWSAYCGKWVFVHRQPGHPVCVCVCVCADWHGPGFRVDRGQRTVGKQNKAGGGTGIGLLMLLRLGLMLLAWESLSSNIIIYGHGLAWHSRNQSHKWARNFKHTLANFTRNGLMARTNNNSACLQPGPTGWSGLRSKS